MNICKIYRNSNLCLKCVRGLERYLYNELIQFGFQHNDIRISHSSISLSNATLKHAYFISHFSRFTTRLYLEIASFIAKNSNELLSNSKSIQWSKYLNPTLTFMVKSNIEPNVDNFKSNNYTSQVIKDSIKDYFINKQDINVDLKKPDIIFYLELNAAHEFHIYLDLVGLKLNSRHYNKPCLIQDIDPTIANSLLDDTGSTNNIILNVEDFIKYTEEESYYNNLYEKLLDKYILNYRNTNIIDTNCGTGVTLIEAAMLSHGIAPGISRPLASEHIPFKDKPSMDKIAEYSSLIRRVKELKKHEFVSYGIEKNWDKIKIAVNNANNAGVLKSIKISKGSPLDTFRYITENLTNPVYIFTCPLTGELIKEIRNNKTNALKNYHRLLLNKLSRNISLNSKLLLLIPNCYKKKDVEEAVEHKLDGGRVVYFKGIHWACYTYNCNDNITVR